MDMYSFYSNFGSVNSCSLDYLDDPSGLTDDFISPPSMAGHSAQRHDPADHGHLNQEIKDDRTTSPRSLNDFSISPLPVNEDELALPEFFSLEGLDTVFPYNSASERVDNDFSLTDLTSTDFPASVDKQTPPTEKRTDGNASVSERKRKRNYPARQRQQKNQRYQNDPDYAERLKKQQRERYQNDPDYAARKKERQRERRKDPAYAERERQHKRELRKDPAYVKREREHQTALYKDPTYVECRRRCQRERYQNDPEYAARRRELSNKPVYRERQKKRQRERYQKDPDYAERERKRKRERRKDPVYAEHEKELQRKRRMKQAISEG
ncbi:hypothetical protein [Endozoicomonas sp. SESOKO1]|uniref:hypothetical protein n=1 Tax=Endozoicomonas sp. SESOKO1 TaxID=2828742 RepID=UPI00214899AD|nr:hypothetical protein [Endozoicomonas sp. SESOKO1]